jgi:hypothetical protein
MDLTFNLRSMNKLERDIKVLMASLKMKNIEDMTQSVLNNQNKSMVVGVALSLTELLKRSQNLLKDAASDLDCMKNEQLKNQARLLEVQEELSEKKCQQLEAVKCTVDEKLTTWASVVKKNTNQIVDNIGVKKALKTALHESDREFNVVMFNVEEEDENGDSSEEFNNEVALDVMKCAGLDSFAGDFSAERIGVADTERSRPLKVKFDYKAAAFDLLSCSKYLKDDEKYSAVFIEPDRSREQRIAHRKLVQQLRTKRNSDHSKRYYIWNNTICSSPFD